MAPLYVNCTSLYNILLHFCYFQVEGRKSIWRTLQNLLRNEGPMALTKGMFASAVSEMPCSVITILGYEFVKKLSLKEDIIYN